MKHKTCKHLHVFRVGFKITNRKVKDLEKQHVLNRAVVLINVWTNVILRSDLKLEFPRDWPTNSQFPKDSCKCRHRKTTVENFEVQNNSVRVRVRERNRERQTHIAVD